MVWHPHTLTNTSPHTSNLKTLGLDLSIKWLSIEIFFLYCMEIYTFYRNVLCGNTFYISFFKLNLYFFYLAIQCSFNEVSKKKKTIKGKPIFSSLRFATQCRFTQILESPKNNKQIHYFLCFIMKVNLGIFYIYLF